MRPEMQSMAPLTAVVKRLLIVSIVFWFGAIVVLEQFFLSTPIITYSLGLSPLRLLNSFQLWQPITYMFVHSRDPFHIIFNMLMLWLMGGELERYWGSRFFTIYYFFCGIGAGLLYVLAVCIYALAVGRIDVMGGLLIGSSSAIFGLLLAYGLIFGERIVYFMMVFPMKAKLFVAVLGAIQLVMVLNNDMNQSKVTALSHLGGIICGFILLKIWPRIQRGGFKGPRSKTKGGKLRLIVNNNEGFEQEEKPKYWN